MTKYVGWEYEHVSMDTQKEMLKEINRLGKERFRVILAHPDGSYLMGREIPDIEEDDESETRIVPRNETEEYL